MTSDQPTRKVVKILRDAGWFPARAMTGSHEVWEGPNGTRFTVPTGHRTISPGVYRKLLAAMKEDENR